MNKDERKAVADRIRDNSHLSYHELARLTSLSYSTITRIAGEFGIRRKTGRKAEPEQES